MNDRPATIQDLMRVCGLGRETVKAAIRHGDLPGSKVGGRYVIPREAFDRYVRGEWVPQPRHIDIQPLPTVRLLHRRVG